MFILECIYIYIYISVYTHVSSSLDMTWSNKFVRFVSIFLLMTRKVYIIFVF